MSCNVNLVGTILPTQPPFMQTVGGHCCDMSKYSYSAIEDMNRSAIEILARYLSDVLYNVLTSETKYECSL